MPIESTHSKGFFHIILLFHNQKNRQGVTTYEKDGKDFFKAYNPTFFSVYLYRMLSNSIVFLCETFKTEGVNLCMSTMQSMFVYRWQLQLQCHRTVLFFCWYDTTL